MLNFQEEISEMKSELNDALEREKQCYDKMDVLRAEQEQKE